MINAEKFGKRLKKVMEHYQLSAAGFADEIGVQRSSISHLLSGRNKPSLDFVLKVLERFKEVELYWLLNGKGNFPNTVTGPSALPDSEGSTRIVGSKADVRSIERIVLFYTDGTFDEFTP